MTTQSVRVVARIIALHDKVEETKAMLMALIEPTRQEAGCLQYQLLQNLADLILPLLRSGNRSRHYTPIWVRHTSLRQWHRFPI